MDDPIFETPIMFAQTREDPMVEINALHEISKTNDNLEVCLIASAGDTICSIMCDDVAKNIGKIDAIDLNDYQLRLAALKCGITALYDPVTRFHMLAGNIYPEISVTNYAVTIGELIVAKRLPPDSLNFWFDDNKKNFSMLESGINQAGRFEILFKYVTEKEDFDKWFDHAYLTKVFGENATKYSMNRSFADHFRNVLNTYETNYAIQYDNYFYHQFCHNEYSDTSDLPIYLKNQIVNSDISTNFIKNSMLAHLETSKNKSYDLVSLSNITDWLNPNVLAHLLDEVGRTLKPNGKCVLRRLNSDTNLEKFLQEFYPTIGKYQYDISPNIFDKSHFYSEVIIITKKFIKHELQNPTINKINLTEIEI